MFDGDMPQVHSIVGIHHMCKTIQQYDGQNLPVQISDRIILIITDLGGSFCILPKKLISSGYAANFHDNETCSVFQQDFENFDT